MAQIRITNVVFEQVTSLFLSPIHIAISFEVMEDLTDEIDWKQYHIQNTFFLYLIRLIYVGSSENSAYDQILDNFSMPPIKKGIMSFKMESNPPDPTRLPSHEILGASAIIISSSYKKQEYVRIGYFIFNTYLDEQALLSDQQQIILEKVYRIVQADNPRIIRFDIDWKKVDYSKLIQQVQSNQSFMFQGQNGLQGNIFGQQQMFQQNMIPQQVQPFNQQMNPQQFGMNQCGITPQQMINPVVNQINPIQGGQQFYGGGQLGMM